MDILEIQGLKKLAEWHIINILNDFSERTGLDIYNVNFNHIDVTSIGSEKKYMHRIEIDVRI